jgi:hypothetical protein
MQFSEFNKFYIFNKFFIKNEKIRLKNLRRIYYKK